jgi:hypothetical protein
MVNYICVINPNCNNAVPPVWTAFEGSGGAGSFDGMYFKPSYGNNQATNPITGGFTCPACGDVVTFHVCYSKNISR